MSKSKEEYYYLTRKLDEVNSAFKGSCDDIDCNKYIFRDLLKKKFKPTLEHKFSCTLSLKLEKEVLLGLLSHKKYRKYRCIKCTVCKKTLDKLDENSTFVSFTRPCEYKDKKCYEHKGFQVHRKCVKKVPTPAGWNKF